MVTINGKKIRKFLSELNSAEYEYIRIQLAMADDARNLIKEFNLSVDRFCELLQIKPEEYPIYLNGGFDFDLMKMALIRAAYHKLKAETITAEGKFVDVVKPNAPEE